MDVYLVNLDDDEEDATTIVDDDEEDATTIPSRNLPLSPQVTATVVATEVMPLPLTVVDLTLRWCMRI